MHAPTSAPTDMMELAEAEQDIERRRTEFARQCEEMVRGQEVLRRLMENR